MAFRMLTTTRYVHHHPNSPRSHSQPNPHHPPPFTGPDSSGTVTNLTAVRSHSPQSSPPADTRPISPFDKAKQPHPSINFADTSRNSLSRARLRRRPQFTSAESHGTFEKSRQCIDYRCKRKCIWFGAGASNWQTGKGAGYERDAEGRRRGLRIPHRQDP